MNVNFHLNKLPMALALFGSASETLWFYITFSSLSLSNLPKVS